MDKPTIYEEWIVSGISCLQLSEEVHLPLNGIPILPNIIVTFPIVPIVHSRKKYAENVLRTLDSCQNLRVYYG